MTSGPQDWRLSSPQQYGPPGAAYGQPPPDWRLSAMQPAPPAGNHPSPYPYAASYRAQYPEDVKRGVAGARARRRLLLRTYWALRIVVIVSGSLVAILSAATAPVALVGALGALAAASETLIATTRIQERAVTTGQLAETLAKQLREYELRVGDYSEGDALVTFYSRVEALREKAAAEQFRLDLFTPGTEGPSGTPANGASS